jgi:ribosomal protein S18 acetylase RimI-like enzyme
MITEITYRQATPEDSDLIYRIKTRSIRPYVAAVYGWDEAFQLSFHKTTFTPGNTRILSLKEAVDGQPGTDTVFGYIEIEYRETEIFLSNILIDEAFQGHGLGSTIIHQLLREADKAVRSEDETADKNYNRAGNEANNANAPVRRPIRLEVFRVNTRARIFYKRLGFRVTGCDLIKYVMERR